MPKSIVLLAVFIVFGLLLIPSGIAISGPQTQIYSYNIISKDPNYLLDDASVFYDGDKLTIQFALNTNYSGHAPSDSYVGLTAGVDLAGIAKLYTWNDGWIDRTGSISYIADKTIKGKTYDHIYYYAFGTLADFWSRKIKLEITATKGQIRNWIESDNNLIVYFGEATSVLKIIVGTTDTITGNSYRVGYVENKGAFSEIVRLGNTDNWTNLGDTPVFSIDNGAFQTGGTVTDGSVVRSEITDVKTILTGSLYGANDMEIITKYYPDYFVYNSSNGTGSSNVWWDGHGLVVVNKVAYMSSGLKNVVPSTADIPILDQLWLAVANSADDEVLCYNWEINESGIGARYVWHHVNGIFWFFGRNNNAKNLNYDWMAIRLFLYNNASTDYWLECQNFWAKSNSSIVITDTTGTSSEMDRGLEYKIVSNNSDEIEIKITKNNSNQTNVMLTLDFVGNLTTVYIYNSTTTITLLDLYNNFTIAAGNHTYTEEATANTEPANMTTCLTSNITGTTRCYVYLPFGNSNDIYIIARPSPITIEIISIIFITPTLPNTTYTTNNYIEANASVNKNATSCLLEWDDGTPANETMTITNADSDTYCWLNTTGLSDGEYTFNAYAAEVSDISSSGGRNITVDTTSPTVIITSPSASEPSTEIEINFTATDTNLFSCYYSLDGGTNTSITSCANTTINTIGGSHTIEVYAQDSAGNIAGSNVSFTVITFSLAVYNATDNATVTDWHIYIFNGSGSELKRYNNNNTLQLNISIIPNGSNEMTIWKANYGNATFNFTNNNFISALSFERHIIGDNFFINITPANNSIYFFGQTFTMNISIPNYAEGNASIWYAFNGTLPYILGCSECTEFSRDVAFGPGANGIFTLINNSQHYLGVNDENKFHNITILNPQYNITFFDEITNKSIDFSANKNGTIEFYCSDRTITQTVTGTLHDFILNCTGTLEIIKFKLFDPNGNHYRELIPIAKTGNLTFYMINTTPTDITKNLVTFLVTDASFTYQNGIMHFRKIILAEGQKDIIDTRIGSDGKVYANLIGGETYTISIESSDGKNSKTLGEYTTPDATTTSQPLTIIDITFIPTTYNYIGTDISWEMQFNTSTGRIYFYWNDSTGETTSIKFWIYNITNVTARTQMYFDSVSGQSHHLFQWDYVTNGNENDTYLGYFEAIHAVHGNITESRPISKETISHKWLGDLPDYLYHIIALFILVFTAAIFGAKHAPVGALILAIEAGLFFYIEWLPAVIGGSPRLSSLLMVSLIAISILAMFIIKRRRI